MSDHAEIWLEPKAAEYTEDGRMWCQDQVWDKSDGHAQRYVRADLHDAAQAEIEQLRAALTAMVDAEVDYMMINDLGDPEMQHNVKIARAALAQDAIE